MSATPGIPPTGREGSLKASLYVFISVGWNFLDFGIDSPGDSGLVWGRPFPAATSLRNWNDLMP